MEIFEYMGKYGHEQLVFCFDAPSGLKAIVGIHDTTLGPALGGTRMWPYASEEDAIVDVLRLSRGMTYKNSAMGLNFGGGKAVIIGDSRKDKSEELFRAFGRFVQSLGGRYLTAEDVGISSEDMAIVATETEYVLGLPERSGDPSPATAFGVYRGMKACAREVYGEESLKGKKVAVQGVGHVGYYLIRYLHDEGAHVYATDIYSDRLERAVADFKITPVKPEEIYGLDVDIFAPCALGAVVNDETIPQFKCKIIAGAANNQLKEPRHGEVLTEKGILYAPDFVINGGGVTNVADEYEAGGYNHDRAFAKVARIYDKVARVIEIARSQNIPTYVAANVMAEERIAKIGRLKRIYLP